MKYVFFPFFSPIFSYSFKPHFLTQCSGKGIDVVFLKDYLIYVYNLKLNDL